jgi:hypothetical protein
MEGEIEAKEQAEIGDGEGSLMGARKMPQF